MALEPFKQHTGLVATLNRANVDTDQIIPKQFLKGTNRSGFGHIAFYDWRYLEDGKTPNPEFELNQPRYQGASILLARQNFGCGSSREHAVWALKEYGFRVFIAPFFADIFYNNCFNNGLLPIALDDDTVEMLFRRTYDNPGYKLTVDLEACTISDDQGLNLSFEIDPVRRQMLLMGLDKIGMTLLHEDKIAAYEAKRTAWQKAGVF